jgi:hypothetical protein
MKVDEARRNSSPDRREVAEIVVKALSPQKPLKAKARKPRGPNKKNRR